jgi:ubiquinone/menaquinone biosynthesis C-methylase UbiE
MKRRHVESHLDAWDKDYRIRGRLWGGITKDLADLPEGSVVLELGCGSGKTISAMSGRPWKVIALDISSEALRLSRQAASDIYLLLADACHLPFRDEVFDAVFAFHITGHQLLEGRRVIASEASRVLRIGGVLFFREFCEDDMRAGRGEEVEPHTFRRGEGVITHYFTENEVSDLFCRLEALSIRSHRWKMRIKGESLQRSEISAVLVKRTCSDRKSVSPECSRYNDTP